VASKRNLMFVLAGAVALSTTAVAWAQSAREQEIIDRIKPVGEVCVEGDSACAAPVAAVASGPRSGEQVYGTACVACHDSGLAGAPKIGVAADWAPRLAQGEEALVANAINGIRGMPPRGTCMNCSDEEIKLAVEHILAKSQ